MVTVDQALREAAAARPFAIAAAEQARAARAEVGVAQGRYLPRLTLAESLTWTDEPAGAVFILLNQERLSQADMLGAPDSFNHPPSRKDFETRLTVEQPLFDPDLAYGARRAEQKAQAAAAAAGRSAEEAAFAAFRAYLEVQRAQAARVWVESSRREAEETERLAAERRAAGVGLKADWLRARVALAEAERRRTTAESDLLLARRALALAMGRDGGEMEIAGPITAERLELPEAAARRRGDLEALDRQAEAAALAWRQSRAAWLPRAGLVASYALHDAQAPFGTGAGSWMVRAGLTWELFDGGARAGGTERAAAERRAADARLLEAHRQARFQAEEARQRVAEARDHLVSARAAVAEAEEGRRLFGERYAAGLSDLAELLAAQAALDRARFAAVEAESNLLLALGNSLFQRGAFLATLAPAEAEVKP
jgi:outer membrane protein TolC